MKTKAKTIGRRDALRTMAAALGISTIAIDGLLAHDQEDKSKPKKTEGPVQVTTLSRHRLPGENEQEITMVLVEYAAGAASGAHRHPGMVLGFIIEGAVESKVEGQPMAAYKAGDVFYEPEGVIHEISRNVSKTERARFLAVHISPKGAPVVLPVNH